MKDPIGIIGGMGPMASQLFYKMVTEHTAAEKDQDHINLILLSDASMPDRTGAILAHQYEGPYNQLQGDCHYLQHSAFLRRYDCRSDRDSDPSYDSRNGGSGCGRMRKRGEDRHYGD